MVSEGALCFGVGRGVEFDGLRALRGVRRGGFGAAALEEGEEGGFAGVFGAKEDNGRGDGVCGGGGEDEV